MLESAYDSNDNVVTRDGGVRVRDVVVVEVPDGPADGMLVIRRVLFVLWPDDEETDETEPLERDAVWIAADSLAALKPMASAPGSQDKLALNWRNSKLQQPIDDNATTEAITWLDERLEGLSQLVAH